MGSQNTYIHTSCYIANKRLPRCMYNSIQTPGFVETYLIYDLR